MEQQRIWAHFQTDGLGTFRHAQGRYAAMVKTACKLGRSGSRVLNVGIGPGVVERALHGRGWRVAALDPSDAAVAALARDGIDARVGWAQSMSFGSAEFDVVIASEVLEHIEPDVREAVYGEVRRVLRPGGWFIGSVPYREDLRDAEVACPDCGKIFHRWGHVSRFGLDDLRRELSAHFSVIKLQRTAFVDWSEVRTSGSFARAIAKYLLGRLGEAIVSPSIRFVARSFPHV